MFRLALASILIVGSAGLVRAQDAEMKPLSTEAALRVAKLLEEFDPNSYSLDVPYVDSSGKVSTVRLGRAVGLGDVQQTSVEREFETAALASTNTNNNVFRTASTNTNNNVFRIASTNTNNNVFRTASTNTNNNVFRTASTNTNNNIFRVESTNTNNNVFANDSQGSSILELKTILENSFDPGMKPLTGEEVARVAKLLEEFDPNSYSLEVPVRDAAGKVTQTKLGKAVGLADLKQSSLEREFTSALAASTNTNNNVFRVASTNTNNNVFRSASTNTNNNVFRVASTNTNNNVFRVASTNTNNNVFRVASTNTNNNVFVNMNQAAAARELNTLLQSKQ